MSCTNAVATEQIPKPSVTAGKNQPGPIHLHAIYETNSSLVTQLVVLLEYVYARLHC